MKRALSVQEVLSMKKAVLPFEGKWAEAFGAPERTGVWFVWGNSGNGKTSFVMQLCKELCKFGRVAYDSLEEGDSLSVQNSFIRHGISAANKRMQLLNCEPMDELSERMCRRKSPDFYVIDSFQYTQMSYKEYIRFKEAHRDKLIIFTSHTDGRNPAGRAAKSVMYDSALKIWIEGWSAFSKGRFIGSTGKFTIWEEGAAEYWGNKD
ncbi:MAG: hypothetical protein LBH61_03270 [Dysgonamonadaceae bacterium]|jgi:hypothetical protein|nr:hypothetical protein [Dysgonamonadaceae bacterium]